MASKDKSKKKNGGMFVVDAKVLVKAIDRISAVVPNSDISYFCFSDNERLSLLGLKDDTFCIVDLGQGTGSGQYIFIQDIQFMKGIVKNRGNLETTLEANDLTFTSGRYKGQVKINQEVSTATFNMIEHFVEKYATEEGKGSLDLNVKFFSLVSRAVGITRLTNQFVEGYVSSATVEYKNSNLRIVASDNWHVHMLTNNEVVLDKPEKKKKKDKKDKVSMPGFKISIATNVFSMLDKTVGSDLKFFMNNDSFVIRGDDIVIVLPPVQDTDSSHAVEFIKNLKDPICSFKTDTSMQAVLENLSTLVKGKDGAEIELKVAENYIGLSHKSDSGSVSDRMKISDFKGSPITIRLDPRIFYDTFKTIKNAPKFSFQIYANEEGVPAIYVMRGKCAEGDITTVGYAG